MNAEKIGPDENVQITYDGTKVVLVIETDPSKVAGEVSSTGKSTVIARATVTAPTRTKVSITAYNVIPKGKR